MDQPIRRFLKKLKHYLALQKILDLLPLFFAAGFTAACFPAIISCLHPFYYAGRLGITLILVSAALFFFFFLLHYPKEKEAALAGDLAVGHERLLTALELRGTETEIARLQKQDTLRAIQACDYKASFPYRIRYRRFLLLAAAVLLFFLFSLLPSDAKTEAAKLHKAKETAQKETVLLNKAEKEAEKLLDEQNFKKLKTLTEEAKQELSEANTKKKVKKAKARFTSKLRRLKTLATPPLAKALSAVAKTAGIPESELTEKRPSETNSQENTENSQKYENSESSGKNKDSGKGENSGESKNSGEGEDSGKNEGSGKGEDSDKSKGSDEGKGENSGKNEGSGKSEGSDEGKGENSGKNEGSGEGEGFGKNEGSGEGEGSGKGKNSGKGEGSGGGKNYGSKQGIERESKLSKTPEELVIPTETGNDENLTGTVSENGNSQTAASDSPVSAGEKKDYKEVLDDYSRKAYSSIQNEEIPDSMREIVKNYFLSLNE